MHLNTTGRISLFRASKERRNHQDYMTRKIALRCQQRTSKHANLIGGPSQHVLLVLREAIKGFLQLIRREKVLIALNNRGNSQTICASHKSAICSMCMPLKRSPVARLTPG